MLILIIDPSCQLWTCDFCPPAPASNISRRLFQAPQDVWIRSRVFSAFAAAALGFRKCHKRWQRPAFKLFIPLPSRYSGVALQAGTDGSPSQGAFIPPGWDSEENEVDDEFYTFDQALAAEGLSCPSRLQGRKAELVEEVNLWHFAMLNDVKRNEFFWNAMKSQVQGKRVLDVGAGSGLLSMMAAKLGAESVIALEANSDMVKLAETNIERNALDEQIEVIHALSTSVECPDHKRVQVIVSETLGTLLNGESTIEYLVDARKRLAVPGASVIPAGGAQHCVLVMSPLLEQFTGVNSLGSGAGTCHGLDLSAMNVLRDTAQAVSPTSWGFNLSDLSDLVLMSERVKLFESDFSQGTIDEIPAEQSVRLTASCDGIVHAVVATWEVWSDPGRTFTLSTHLEVGEKNGNAQHSHFSQALQLIDENDSIGADQEDDVVAPKLFHVTAGEQLLLHARYNCSRTLVQFSLHRAS